MPGTENEEGTFVCHIWMEQSYEKKQQHNNYVAETMTTTTRTKRQRHTHKNKHRKEIIVCSSSCMFFAFGENNLLGFWFRLTSRIDLSYIQHENYPCWCVHQQHVYIKERTIQTAIKYQFPCRDTTATEASNKKPKSPRNYYHSSCVRWSCDVAFGLW